MKKPLIGIVLDHEPPGGYASFPWYALREHYFHAVTNAGGIPIALPYAHAHIESYMGLIQGLVIPGGDFDIDPALYGAKPHAASQATKNHRTHFEMALLGQALDRRLPFLGICAGMQLLNVARGGTLYQDIGQELPGALAHEQTTPKNEPSHPIAVMECTALFTLARGACAQVNSTHHQAVRTLGKGLVTSAVAPDGVIEAVEDPTQPFCFGIQWHPEYETTALDRAIFHTLIEKAQHP